MNKIAVNEVVFEASDWALEKLKASGAIYFCDEHQAWHLTPDHEFTLSDVETIMFMAEDEQP